MLSVKISNPAHLNKGLRGAIKLYGFLCPGCRIYLSQLSNVLTPVNCKICFVDLPDIGGLIDKAVCRIGYHIEKGRE